MQKVNDFVFIIGCGHSGTTIINKIIGNHRDVFGIENETSLFYNRHKILSTLSMYSNKRDERSKRLVCEKTPRHVYKINEIYEHVSNPKIIVMVRDGRDVVASLIERHQNFSKSVNRWIDDNNAWINHPSHKEFCVVKYENFVSNPKDTIKCICEYLNIEYYDELLDYPKISVERPEINKKKIDGKLHDDLRKYQINQNIYDGTRRYLKDLSTSDLEKLYSNKAFMDLMLYFDFCNCN